MSEIKFLKIRDVKNPVRAHQYDAGIDFFVPKFNKDFIEVLMEKNPQLFNLEPDPSESGTISFASTNTNVSFVSNAQTTVNYNTVDDAKKDDVELIGYDPVKGPYFLLLPYNRIMIPSGIKSRMETSNRALIGANKSGVSTKLGLIFGAHIIDYTYKGEIHISVVNTSTKILKIFQDQKLIQFIETPIIQSNINVTDNLDNIVKVEKVFYDGLEDDRGETGFGDSDKPKDA